MGTTAAVWKQIRHVVAARKPVMIWGPPGVGKTTRMAEIANQAGRQLHTVICSIREPSDLAGLPRLEADRVNLIPPNWARELAEDGGVLFLDELSAAPPAVQVAALRIIHERVVGDLQLPDSVSIVAAANPPGTTTGVFDLSAAAASRFWHAEVSADVEDWAIWATGQGPNHAYISAFLRQRPDLLLALPSNPAQAGRQWPCPRSWDMSAQLLDTNAPKGLGLTKLTDEEQLESFAMVEGAVGAPAASEYLNWVIKQDLQDPEDLLKNPTILNLKNAGGTDRAFAILSSVVSVVANKPTQERVRAAWEVLSQANEQGVRDVAAATAASMMQNEKITATRTKIPSSALAGFSHLMKYTDPANAGGPKQ